MSDEFDALLATTELERSKADGIRSLIAASRLAAGVSGPGRGGRGGTGEGLRAVRRMDRPRVSRSSPRRDEGAEAMTLRERVILAFGIFATTYAAHGAIVNIRRSHDWAGAFLITLTVIAGATLIEFLRMIPNRSKP